MRGLRATQLVESSWTPSEAHPRFHLPRLRGRKGGCRQAIQLRSTTGQGLAQDQLHRNWMNKAGLFLSGSNYRQHERDNFNLKLKDLSLQLESIRFIQAALLI